MPSTCPSITILFHDPPYSRALEDSAYRRGLQMDFIRQGKPEENAVIERYK
jgi:putative transposase